MCHGLDRGLGSSAQGNTQQNKIVKGRFNCGYINDGSLGRKEGRKQFPVTSFASYWQRRHFRPNLHFSNYKLWKCCQSTKTMSSCFYFWKFLIVSPQRYSQIIVVVIIAYSGKYWTLVNPSTPTYNLRGLRSDYCLLSTHILKHFFPSYTPPCRTTTKIGLDQGWLYAMARSYDKVG